MGIAPEEWLQLLKQHRAIAVIRCAEINLAYNMAHAVAAGGMSLIEITWNSEHPEKLLARLRAELPHCIVGAGTILNLNQLEQAVLAGAQFAFSPHFNADLLSAALNLHKIPFVPGVFSPTEIVNAWQHGAEVVKVFPIKSLGGAEYIKCVQAPLDRVALIPTGGITIENAGAMIDAGAIAVGISSSLFPRQAIALKDWQNITAIAQKLLSQLHKK